MTRPLFTFAIVADTHINPVDGESGSPWRSNALANARARWTVAALNADRPDFVLHLGDMVHPVPAQASYATAAERFHAIFAKLDAPLHVLPGNHDIGDKPGDWMPAHTVTPAAMAAYRDTFGAPWRAFDRGDCRFVLHCNPILGSGLPEDAEQWDWLDRTLSASGGKRVFFLTHYPLFLTRQDEPEHYDNLAFPARDRLRRLLVKHGVEAVFAAHVHNIFHTALSDRDGAPMQHVVPCVSAVRLDYSHLFRRPPGPGQEHGRNDTGKLGYYLVDVMPEGYRIRLRRTEGCALPEAQADFDPGAMIAYREPLANRPLGVDLRHGWADIHAIPYSGVVDEFRRKYVRNDYLLTALQEAGVRDLRVPLDDLKDGAIRARMGDFARFGHRFQAFTIDEPDDATAEVLRRTPAVSALEVIARPDRLDPRLSAWRAALGDGGPALLASQLWASADVETEAVAFSHAIGHGFFPSDAALFRPLADAANGLVIRIGPGEDPAAAIAALPADLPGRIVIYLALHTSDPARMAVDDAAQANRIFAALAAIRALGPRATLMLDTLEDLDRGYYPRHGLYDGQFNPRPAAIRLSVSELGFPSEGLAHDTERDTRHRVAS
ncbi:serine/threonine protein phosphatase [Rhodobacterales bacterium HKCCE2091]|nr:serine/threonine protein phosphatase [Rhodobacterales bacterium HKCCE2091]